MRTAPRASTERRRALRRGRFGELLCRWHLRLRGWRIVARGWRCPSGEIDIIARRGRVLAVIEVKARADLADAVAAVLPRQRRRIARATSISSWTARTYGTRPAICTAALFIAGLATRPVSSTRRLYTVAVTAFSSCGSACAKALATSVFSPKSLTVPSSPRSWLTT